MFGGSLNLKACICAILNAFFFPLLRLKAYRIGLEKWQIYYCHITKWLRIRKDSQSRQDRGFVIQFAFLTDPAWLIRKFEQRLLITPLAFITALIHFVHTSSYDIEMSQGISFSIDPVPSKTQLCWWTSNGSPDTWWPDWASRVYNLSSVLHISISER